MNNLDKLVIEISELPDALRTRKHVSIMKREWAKREWSKDLPTNITLFKTYKQLVDAWVMLENKEIAVLFKKRSVRSLSGIVPVQVLTKPFWCPGKCIFCPNDASMPKSYINTQPWAMRALLNNFDPYKQTYNRLLSLMMTWHETDKIEMIVLWWTWDVYPQEYKIEFIKWLYDACNTFTEFLQKIDIDYENPKAARYTRTEDFDVSYPETIQESMVINETATNRIIWLTIETRPEYVTHENCQFWRDVWVTRLEMWIQTLHNDVHEANVRGHDNTAIRNAMHMLRQYAFKVSNHYMPWLYTSTPEKDLETFQIAFATPWIKSDELKFYPTAVIPNTPLYDLFKAGEYQPIQDDDLKHIVRAFKDSIVPPYSRIKRLARDFDTNEVVAGANTPNLRQLVMNAMKKEYAADLTLRKQQYARLSRAYHQVWKTDVSNDVMHLDDQKWVLEYIATPLSTETSTYTSLSHEDWVIDETIETICIGGMFDLKQERNFVCLCTRCREIRNRDWEPGTPFLVVRRYRSSVWEEYFLSFEDELWYLYGFTRLLLPDTEHAIEYAWLWKHTALVRELHVYGSLQSLTKKSSEDATQHVWFWSQLIRFAEDIARTRGYTKQSIIAGVGVRKYYERKLWYILEWTYMVRDLG